MASRRLDADPFLNELFDEDHYTQFGLNHVEATNGIVDLLRRHYPSIAAPFDMKGQSAFKPLFGPEKWEKAIKEGVVDPKLVKMWKKTKEDNKAYFDSIDDDLWPESTASVPLVSKPGYGSIN